MTRILCNARAFVSSAALVVLGACSSGSSVTPVVTAGAAMQAVHKSLMRMQAANGTGDVLVVDSSKSAIDVFSVAGSALTPVAEITTGVDEPMPITTDKRGNLYVGNLGDSTIKEYLNGSTTPSTVIHGVYNPQGLAIDAKGDLWVTQLPKKSADFAAVEEYQYDLETKAFSSKPIKTISGTGEIALVAPRGLTVNSAGDVFIADPTQPANVFKVEAGSSTVQLVPLPQIPPLFGPTSIQAPYDVKVIEAGGKETFYVSDYIGGGVVGFSKNGTLVWASNNAGEGAGSTDGYGNEGYLALDAAGNVFCAVDGLLAEYAPSRNTGGYVGQGAFLGVATAQKW